MLPYKIIGRKTTEFEILICNDGPHSKDEILAMIDKRLHEKIRILNNRGEKEHGLARNIGINNAKFEYIAFLDADDIWHENKSLCKWKRLKRDIILFVQGIFLGRRLKLRPLKKLKYF